jgi:hypothetical protein
VAVFFQGHRRGRLPVDHRQLPAQPVTALDGAVNPLFALHLQQSCLGQ